MSFGCKIFGLNVYVFIVSVLTFVGLGCAQSKQDRPLHPISEAYALMDKGQNAKAILILEDTVSRDPDNSEARVLLASAYLGEAGVDVYKIHDTFKDVLFNKSLEDSFLGESNHDAPAADPILEVPNVNGPDNSENPRINDKALIEGILFRLDHTLTQLRQGITFLNRFPDVDKIKWGLLDKALEELSWVEPTRDICLYRIFIRVIYLRAYLGQEIIINSEFGTRNWACRLDIEKLRESLIWITRNLVHASEDYRKVYPDKSHSWVRFQGTIMAFLEALEQVKTNAPLGANSGILGLQQRLREAFKCNESADF